MNLILKWVEEMNRHSSKENIQMPNSYLYIDSALLIIREMRIKAIMRYHFIPGRVIIIKQTCDNNVDKRDPWCTVGRNVSWYSHYGRLYREFSKFF